MSDKKEIFDVSLDNEERELLDSVERGEWQSIANLKKEKTAAKKMAASHLHKDARVNIRISSTDLAALKQKAAYKGLPYQTFIASVLHEYAAGQLQHL
jgi:predicted DNA binding CopG/RHH family protein